MWDIRSIQLLRIVAVVGCVALGELTAPAGFAQQARLLLDESIPERWIVDVPPSDRVCPPTRNAFTDASRTISRVGSRTFKHELNGGWHRVGQGTVNGKQIFHVGVDVGLYRVGEPVYAVANGIVRVSNGPVPPAKRRGSRKDKGATGASEKESQTFAARGMPWGNLIVVEHHFPREGYFTSVYGHLDTNRLVETGEPVTAGQMIGRIGAQNPQINGGYIPHLHFGIRKDRMGEEDTVLTWVPIDGKLFAMRMSRITEDKIEISLDKDNPIEPPPGVNMPPVSFDIANPPRELSARLLWTMSRHDFAIAGHTDTPEHWIQPLSFLKNHGALTRPAPFRRAMRRPKAKATPGKD